MPGTSHSEIRVPLPGSGFMITYKSQGERDRTLRLAEARQQLAHEGNGNPTWQELTDDERGTSELSARNWLRAAGLAGLIAEQGQVDDDQADAEDYADDWTPGERMSADAEFASEAPARWCALCERVEYTDMCPNQRTDGWRP